MSWPPAVHPALPLLVLLTAAGPALALGAAFPRRSRGAQGRRSVPRGAVPAAPVRRASATPSVRGESPDRPDGPDGGRGWRDLALPWTAVGLAALALLAPVLALPGGVPSPAAALAALPPWQAAGAAPAAGNPVLRDVTFQIQPWLLFARRELRAGRLPLWNPYQSAGAPFWGNGQSAPLFPLHLLFAALPLQVGFNLLPWLRLVAGGCGVWRLGRELGLGLQAALLAALTFALSGMPVSFALFPMGNALALAPWVLWTVERVAAAAPAPGSGPVAWRAPALLALAAGLQLLAGHPETAVHTALLGAVYLAVRGAARPVAAWLGFAAGWLGGAALAAVQLLPLALTLPETARWQAAAGGAEPPLALLLRQPLRLLLPELYGHPARGTWWGPFNYSATAVYAGALALPLAAAGLARCRRDRRWTALAVTAGFAFLAAYHCPGVRDLLGALPVLGRAAQHRLIFGVEMGLALLAGAGCDEWLAGAGRGAVAGAAAALAGLAAAWVLFHRAWADHGLVATEAGWTAAVAAAAVLLALSLRLDAGRRRRLAPLLPALAVLDLLIAHGAINPGLPLARLFPRTGAVRFLAGLPGRVAGTGQALRPDAAMVYGLRDVRGDDPVKLVRYEAVYSGLAAGDPVYFEPITAWRSPWLDRLGVRWVVAGPGEPPPVDGWRTAYGGPDATVYERPTALPLVRWAAAPDTSLAAVPPRPTDPGTREAPPTVLTQEPGLWRIAWDRAAAPRLLIVAETWERGWRARVAGRPRPLEAAGGLLLALRVGPGAGQAELRYRPPGLAAGAALSLVAWLLLAGGWMLAPSGPPAAPASVAPPAPVEPSASLAPPGVRRWRGKRSGTPGDGQDPAAGGGAA